MSNTLNIETLEKFVFANNRQKALSELTPYSNEYYFVELHEKLNTHPEVYSLKKEVEIFTQNHKYESMQRDLIKAEFYLLALKQSEKSPERFNKLIDEIGKDFLHLIFDHQRP